MARSILIALAAMTIAVVVSLPYTTPASAQIGVAGGSVDVSSMPADATELPAVSALGDNLTPPSSPFVYSLLYCWDATGGNADRCLANPCNGTTSSANISTASSGNVQLVALSGSTKVYVCGISLIGEGDTTVQLINGTGTACATGETDMATWDLTTNSGIALSNGGSIQFVTDAGDALCIENSAAIQVGGHVTYVQQ